MCPEDMPPLVDRKASLHLPGMDKQSQTECSDSSADQAHNPDNSSWALIGNRLKLDSARVDLQNSNQIRNKKTPIPPQEPLYDLHLILTTYARIIAAPFIPGLVSRRPLAAPQMLADYYRSLAHTISMNKIGPTHSSSCQGCTDLYPEATPLPPSPFPVKL